LTYRDVPASPYLYGRWLTLTEDKYVPIASKLELRLLFLPIVAGLSLGGLACVIQSPAIEPVNMLKPPTLVRSPVKAHLLDGSTVVYPSGFTLAGDRITSTGQRYALGSGTSVGSINIPLDSIVGMETYDRRVNVPASVLASAAATAGGALLTVGALIAIFGSCPTFYADSAGVELLQGEGFSYSVAPLLEQRDVDRLRLAPTLDGRVVLHVRNEALETHYINHIEIIEALHGKEEVILPDQGGRPVAVSNAVAPLSVRDRSGRDISQAVRAADDDVFSTNLSTLENVTESDLDDWIDIVIPAPGDADSVAIVMDMRNSLLNTVLLYDHILGAPGVKSLDFLGKDLENISGAVEMAKWYSSHMGMRVSVLDGGSWRRVARIGDSGPIAYHQLAVMVPAIRNDGGSGIRVRLAFVADDWRIDAIRASTSYRRPVTRSIPAARVAMSNASQNDAALASLIEPDEGYLITSPGHSFRVEFDAGKQVSESRTFMLASQGYYTEWVRGSWIKSASGEPFVPSSAALLKAIRGWRAKQGDMERRFYSSRIATR